MDYTARYGLEFNPSLYKVIYTSLSTLTVMEFYRNLVAELGGVPAFRKPDNFRLIQGEITRLALEKRQTPVIIIDEANYINTAVLNDLKILFNFDMDSRDRAVILLAGLPQLNNTLRLGIHEPLRQRIVMNYNMDALSKEEGRDYITAKLKGAGCSQTVFDENAIEAILNAANGETKNWKVSWDILVEDHWRHELLVRARGSEYRVVLGTCTTGLYMCIPAIDVGCGLSHSADRLWNTEKISSVLNETDAVSIATVIYHYGLLS